METTDAVYSDSPVGLSERGAFDCKCKFEVLAIRNQLEKNAVVVDVIETQTGIILRGISLTLEDNPYYGDEGHEDDEQYFRHITFADYSEKAEMSYPSLDEQGSLEEVLKHGQPNFGQAVVAAVKTFMKNVSEYFEI